MSIDIRSENLKVFPISHSREGKVEYYTRNENYENMEAYGLLAAHPTEKSIVENNNTINITVYNSYPLLQALYDHTETTTDHPETCNGRALTERNLSSVLRKLTDRDCYVIEFNLAISQPAETPQKYSDDAYIDFMLNGRYFNLSLTNIEVAPLWVGIQLIDKEKPFEMLNIVDTVIGDVENPSVIVSEGVVFSNEELYTSTSKPDGYSGTVYDYVLELIDAEGNVPINSVFRFDKHVIKNISGGTV